MIDRILIPTDGSEEAEAAIDYGLKLASLTGAEVHALYVIETRASYIITVDFAGEEMKEHEQWGDETVGDVVTRATALGLEATGTVRKGKIAQEIVEYAQTNDIDQIVMGRRGQGAIGRYIGSTAEKVIHMAELPVTVVEA